MSEAVEVVISQPDVAPALGVIWEALARLEARVVEARREHGDMQQAARRANRGPARALAALEEYLSTVEVEDPEEVARLERAVREANALVEYRPIPAAGDGRTRMVGLDPVDVAAEARVRRAARRLEDAVAERDRFRAERWADLLVEAAPHAQDAADRVNEAREALQAALGAYDDVGGAIVRLGADTGLWAPADVPSPVGASELNRLAAAARVVPPIPRGVLDGVEVSADAE